MKTKFEVCEGCPIENKDDCLIAFGSKECAKILVSGILKEESNKNKPVLVIDDGTSKLLEVKEKIVVEDDTKGYRVKESYAVIKLGDDEPVPEVEIFDILRDWMIPYRIVEVLDLDKHYAKH